MNIKTLEWVRTSFNPRVISNGKRIVMETWIAKTAFFEYKVFSTLSGRCFVVLPGTSDGGLPGFFRDSLTGPPRTECDSIADGKSKAEAHWVKVISTALE